MNPREHAPDERVRIDKWLWAARFHKTRSMASEAVSGGKVHLNGQRVKPAREVRPGDRLDITIGEMRWSVVVRAIAERRGPATAARMLYEETEESLHQRQAQLEARRLSAAAGKGFPPSGGRPTKRHRREIDRLRNAGGARDE